MAKKHPSTAAGAVARIWREADVCHIDVRGLLPPTPMVEVLRLLDSDDVTDRVIMHHDREPVFLFPELAERGWGYEVQRGDGGEYLIYIRRGNE